MAIKLSADIAQTKRQAFSWLESSKGLPLLCLALYLALDQSYGVCHARELTNPHSLQIKEVACG